MTDSNIKTPETLQPHKFECMHCKKEFKNLQSIRAHLSNCPNRLLTRFIHIQKYLVVIFCNPSKRKMVALDALCKKFPDNAEALIAALCYLELAKEIGSFFAQSCEASPEYQKQPPGRVARQMLWKTLSEVDMAKLRTRVDMIK
jgi:hypothetical protein